MVEKDVFMWLTENVRYISLNEVKSVASFAYLMQCFIGVSLSYSSLIQ